MFSLLLFISYGIYTKLKTNVKKYAPDEDTIVLVPSTINFIFQLYCLCSIHMLKL